MTYLFGWRRTDIEVTASGHMANPDQAISLSPADGFSVDADVVVEAIGLEVVGSSAPSNIVGLINESTGELLGSSAVFSGIGEQLVPLTSPVSIAANTPVSFLFLSDGFQAIAREEDNFRFFLRQTRDFSLGLPDPFAADGSTNRPRPLMWAEGTGVIAASTDSDLRSGSQATIRVSGDTPIDSVTIVSRSGAVSQVQAIDSQSYDSVADETPVVITVNEGGLRYELLSSVEVVASNGQSVALDINLLPPATGFYTDIVNPVTTEGSIGYLVEQGGGDLLETGMQLETDGAEFNEDTTPVDPELGSFQYRIWQGETLGWTGWATGEFVDSGNPDPDPDPDPDPPPGDPEIADVNGGNPLVAGQPFTVTVQGVHAEDVHYVRLGAGSSSWNLMPQSVNSATQLTFTAPAGLPSGQSLSFTLFEDKALRRARELEARIEALEP